MTHTLPYITYKEEVLNQDPFMAVYYDVISDQEIERLKSDAFPSLYRAEVASAQSNFKGMFH